VTWTCPNCAHVNGDAAVCDACGVARRWHEDPPLDLPRAPEWHEVPATWLTWAWGALAAAGLLAYAFPPLRATVTSAIGLDATWIGLEAVLASAAFWSSLQEAWFQRHFNQVTVETPTSVRTGGPFEVRLALVPYAGIDGLDLTVELIDRYYVNVRRKGRSTVATRQRLVERVVLERRARLAGRREHVYRVSLDTPFPSTIHEHLGAKIMASVMEPFGWLVPGLRHRARNLREHGGFFVRVTVGSGPFRRRFERRVVVVHLGSTIQFG
jgi:hypothetical protein